MNKDALPTNARALNSWIYTHFNVVGVANKAWLELPFQVSIGDEGEESKTSYNHRIIFMTLGFQGTEEECCQCLAAHLYLSVTRESWQDAAEPLFIRREFSYNENNDFGKLERSVSGRLAFWRSALNKALAKTTCVKMEGGLANKAVMPEGWFDRL